MKIYIGSDHAGYAMKKKVIHFLHSFSTQFEAIDCGPYHSSRVDYPDQANLVCKKVLKEQEGSCLGILICGSGQGMAMRANKYKNIRAALCWNEDTAKLSRNHNQANVLCLGSRTTEEIQIYKIIKTFLSSSFEAGRHKARVEKISSPVRS